MKVKIYNPEYTKFSTLHNRSKAVLENDGMGLSLSYQIFKEKLKQDITFSEFLREFYSNKSQDLPHFLPPEINLYLPYGNKEPEKVTLEEMYQNLSQNSVTSSLIIGDAGHGKTATFLALLNKCMNRVSEREVFLSCNLQINNFNHKDSIEKILIDSLGLKSLEQLDNYLSNTFCTIFFIDANAVSKTISLSGEEINLNSEDIHQDNLLSIIMSLKNYLERINLQASKKHRIFIMYRGKKSFFENKSSQFYNKISQKSLIYEVLGISEDHSIDYIYQVGGENVRNLISRINETTKLEAYNKKSQPSLFTTPLFIDFINWLSLKIEVSFEINSFAQLYMIFTREYMRYEYDQWERKNYFKWLIEDKRIRVFSWDKQKYYYNYLKRESHVVLEQSLYSKISSFFTKNNIDPSLADDNDKINFYYRLEELPHPAELILMLTAHKFGNNFLDTDLTELISDLLSNNKASWLKHYRNYLDRNKISMEEDNLRKSLIENSLLRVGDGVNLEFFHPSISDYYQAKYLFYDFEKGQFVNLSDTNHYRKALVKCNNYEVFQYFLKIIEFEIIKGDYEVNKYLESLGLKGETSFLLGKAFDRNRDINQAIRQYEYTLKIDPKNYLAANNLRIFS